MSNAYVITAEQLNRLALLIVDLDQPSVGQGVKNAAQAAHQIIIDVLGEHAGRFYDMSEPA